METKGAETMKEFNLSKEITEAYGWNDHTKVIQIDYVKEFIRLLHESYGKNTDLELKHLIVLNYNLDKLAGEKLI